MFDVIATLGAAAALASLPGTATLATLSLAALLPARSRPNTLAEKGKLAIVVPAHNEAASIVQTVSKLLDECRGDGHTGLWVVADNCSDDTAALADTAGARVMIRNHADERGKGYALDHAFTQLAGQDYAWFIVIDADSEVRPGFLAVMRLAMQPETKALQACYLSRPAISRRGRLARFAQFGFNHVRLLGRQRLGQSVGLLGNGFALRSELLQSLPYKARSVVEDLEYHLDLVEAGIKVAYVPEALVLGEIAESTAGAAQQRARWEGGRLRLLRERSGSLLGKIARGQWHLLDALAELALLPLGMHLLLVLLAGLAVPEIAILACGGGLATIALYIGAIFARSPATFADLSVLCSAPFYIIWKLSLLPMTLAKSRKSASWVRAERMTEHGEKK